MATTSVVRFRDMLLTVLGASVMQGSMPRVVTAQEAAAQADEAPRVVEEQAVDARAAHCASPGSPLAIRACAGLLEVDQGHWLEGEAALESTLALLGPDMDSLRPVMEHALGTARQHLGSIDVTCGPVSGTVEVDGVVQGVTPLLRPVRVLPGTHHVRCTQTDYQAAEADVEVAPMSVASTVLTMEVIDRRPILERIGSPGESQRIVGIVSLSLGGALLAIGFGTLAGALDNAPPLRDELFDVSRGTLIAGGAAVLLGTVLTLTAE